MNGGTVVKRRESALKGVQSGEGNKTNGGWAKKKLQEKGQEPFNSRVGGEGISSEQRPQRQ